LVLFEKKWPNISIFCFCFCGVSKPTRHRDLQNSIAIFSDKIKQVKSIRRYKRCAPPVRLPVCLGRNIPIVPKRVHIAVSLAHDSPRVISEQSTRYAPPPIRDMSRSFCNRNIPAVPNEFIGRERDIADISEFVYTCKETCKVVCLYGRPGVGKSTLAYQIGM
jgi:hypothetical protein